MPPSRWAALSRQRIAETLARLPADADRKMVKAALHAAYPFGERKYLPYRHWCKVQKAALADRFGPAKSAIRANFRVCIGPDGVTCGWCQSTGCIACANARHTFATVQTDWKGWQEWLDYLKVHPDDHVARLAFADFLEEQDWPGEADRIRQEANKET